MTVAVLSQLTTVTVFSAISTTSPSAPNCGISIQSPTRIRSLFVSWMLATSESSVSRKTSRMTAVIAPRPLTKNQGDWPASRATMKMPRIAYTNTFTSWT